MTLDELNYWANIRGFRPLSEKNEAEWLAIVASVLIKPMFEELFNIGYETIWIGPCEHFMSAPDTSVIAKPSVRKGGWPAIWNIVEDYAGLSCGNTDQVQAKNFLVGYFKGKYTKDNYIDLVETVVNIKNLYNLL